MAMYRCPKATKKKIKCRVTLNITYSRDFVYASYDTASKSSGAFVCNGTVVEWYADDPSGTFNFVTKAPVNTAVIMEMGTSVGVFRTYVHPPRSTTENIFKIQYFVQNGYPINAQQGWASYFVIELDSVGKVSSITIEKASAIDVRTTNYLGRLQLFPDRCSHSYAVEYIEEET